MPKSERSRVDGLPRQGESRRAFTAGLLAFAALATRPTRAADAPLERVMLLLDFAYTAGGHTPWFVGKEKGFFREAGLDLDLQPGSGSFDTMKLVGAGRAPIGYCDAGSVSLGIASGVPVRMVAAVYQKTLVSIFSLKSTNIARPKDLEGKKIGLLPGSAEAKVFPAFARKNNLDPGKIEIVNLSFPTRIPSLINRNIDALGAYIIEQPNIRAAANADVNVLRVVDYGVESYGNGFIANNDFAAKNPRIVERFLQAAMRSLGYTIQHPDEALEITLKAIPNVTREAAAERIKLILPFFESDATKRRGLGFMDDSVWAATQNIMLQYGGQTDAVKLDKLYTNKYLTPAGH